MSGRHCKPRRPGRVPVGAAAVAVSAAAAVSYLTIPSASAAVVPMAAGTPSGRYRAH